MRALNFCSGTITYYFEMIVKSSIHLKRLRLFAIPFRRNINSKIPDLIQTVQKCEVLSACAVAAFQEIYPLIPLITLDCASCVNPGRIKSMVTSHSLKSQLRINHEY